jgi:transcription antitermination factor NusG
MRLVLNYPKKAIFGTVFPENTKVMSSETLMAEEKNVPHKDPADVPRWYAIYTHPRAEKLVFSRLSETDIETFLPLMKTYRQWSDRKKMVEKPLISSYLFVKVKKKQFPVVYKIAGVVRFVSFEGQPVPIPQKQIDNLRLIVNSDAEIEVTGEAFAKGDNVEVITGSLTGLTGELIRIGGKKRVIVRIDRLDQNIIVTIPATFLKKV